MADLCYMYSGGIRSCMNKNPEFVRYIEDKKSFFETQVDIGGDDKLYAEPYAPTEDDEMDYNVEGFPFEIWFYKKPYKRKVLISDSSTFDPDL